MVGQVKIVGILMLVHGITVNIMGGILIFVAVMMAAMPPPPAGAGGGGGPDPVIFAIFYGLWGLMILSCGLVNSIAGFRLIYYRGRVFALVALFSNILVLFSCYCAITAIGMMIYGLIVLFQPDVARAFLLVSRGATPEEVVGRLTRRYDDARDDYDDSYRPRDRWRDEEQYDDEDGLEGNDERDKDNRER